MATPSDQEIVNLELKTSLHALCGWAGMDSGLQDRWASLLGFPGGKVGALHPRVVAALPADMYLQAMSTWKAGDIEASFYDKSLALLVHRTACKLFEPIAPVVPAVVKDPEVAAKVDKKVDSRKIKVSNLIDPTDETEVPAASADQLKIWYENYKELKHGEPLIQKEPSPDQIAALHLRVVVLGMEPYADFSLLTPFGRRVAKVLRHRSWIMQEDGSYKPMEVPGPESYDVWNACYKVFEVILLMLRFPQDSGKDMLVVTPAAVEAYHEAFSALVKEHPECWHLCQKAEDRCRAEHFPRLARRLAAALGREPSWSEVFIAAAEDDRFWDREVRRPALCFMARGRRGQERAPSEKKNGDSSRQRQRSRQRSRSPVARRTLAPTIGEKKKAKFGKGSSGGRSGPSEAHPKKIKGKFVTTREGKQICFAFANGERGVCAEPCKEHRMHVCQLCLQPHTNAACSKRG
jgi:hypothetical protein